MVDSKIITHAGQFTKQSRATLSVSGEMALVDDPTLTDHQKKRDITSDADRFEHASSNVGLAPIPKSKLAAKLEEAALDEEKRTALFGPGFRVETHKIKRMDTLRARLVNAVGKMSTISHPAQRFSITHTDGSQVDVIIRPFTKKTGQASFQMDMDIVYRGKTEKHLRVIDRLMARDAAP